MNEENDDFNLEDELNELPGYIQSIINECGTFDKKDCTNKNKENEKKDDKSNNNEVKENECSSNDKNYYNNLDNNNNINDFNEEENFLFDDDKENDYNIENIFNSKSDFFNPKKIDENKKVEINNKNNELKENINNNDINKDNNSNKNNLNIKLYCVQENNLLNIKRSLRLQSILQNNLTGYQNNTYECSICFRRIQNYGLLSNCDDVFCYDCIKQWRTEAISKNKREMFRRCPICNCESPMLIKSKNYVSGEEKRKKFYELKQGKKISQINQ